MKRNYIPIADYIENFKQVNDSLAACLLTLSAFPGVALDEYKMDKYFYSIAFAELQTKMPNEPINQQRIRRLMGDRQEMSIAIAPLRQMLFRELVTVVRARAIETISNKKNKLNETIKSLKSSDLWKILNFLRNASTHNKISERAIAESFGKKEQLIHKEITLNRGVVAKTKSLGADVISGWMVWRICEDVAKVIDDFELQQQKEGQQ